MSSAFSSASPVGADRSSRSALRTFLRNAWETAKVFLVSLAVIIPLRAYVVQPFFVRGDSMAPAFDNGEYLVIDEASLTFGLRSPQRGDVVVFRYPLDPSQYYIKRVIAVGGETVRVSGGAVMISSAQFPQGVVLDEGAYLPPDERTDGDVEVTLKDSEVYLLGDNRDHSSDSRAWGPLPADLVVGRAWIRAFPLRKLGVVGSPWYGSLPLSAAEAIQ